MHIKNMLNFTVVVIDQIGSLNSQENIILNIFKSWLWYLPKGDYIVVVRADISCAIIVFAFEDCKQTILDIWFGIRVVIVVSKVSCSSKKVVIESVSLVLYKFEYFLSGLNPYLICINLRPTVNNMPDH